MAVRTDFTAGEVLTAQDLDDTFASKLDLAGGKILQIVRATDSTLRSTSSTSFVDVTGMSVTITPQKSDSAILLVATFNHRQNTGTTTRRGDYSITDASNNAISGAENAVGGASATNTLTERHTTLVGYSTPATTSATTYKLRFKTQDSTSVNECVNSASTGQMYAIEVSA